MTIETECINDRLTGMFKECLWFLVGTLELVLVSPTTSRNIGPSPNTLTKDINDSRVLSVSP